MPNATDEWQKFSLAFGGQWLALASGSELFLVFPPEAPRRVVLHGVPSISSIAALISRPSAIDPQWYVFSKYYLSNGSNNFI